MANSGTLKKLKDCGVLDGVSSKRELFEGKASENAGSHSFRGPFQREQQTSQRKGRSQEGGGQMNRGKGQRKTWGNTKGNVDCDVTAKETQGNGYYVMLNSGKILRDTEKETTRKMGDDKQVDIGQDQRKTTQTSEGKVDNDQVAIGKALGDKANGNNGGKGIGGMIDTGREAVKEKIRAQLSLPPETPKEEDDDYTEVWVPNNVQSSFLGSDQLDDEKLPAGEERPRDKQNDDDGKHEERHADQSAAEEVLRSVKGDTEHKRVALRRMYSADNRRQGNRQDSTLDPEAMERTQSTSNILQRDRYPISQTNPKHTNYGWCSNNADIDANMVDNCENSYIDSIVPDYITYSRDSDKKNTKAKSGIPQKEHEHKNERHSTSSHKHNDMKSDTQTAKVKEDFLRKMPVRRSERPTTSFYIQLSKEMDALVSRDESSFENVSIKCRPKVVADLYSALCTGEWLNAKEEMENKKTWDEDVQLKFLCSVFEISLSTAKSMKDSLDQKLQDILVPILSQPVHAILHDQVNTGPKHKRPTGRLPDQMLTPIGDYLRAHVNQVDSSPLKQKVTSELKKHIRATMPTLQRPDILREDQNEMHEYIKACSDLAWMMVIQRPQMTFQQERPGTSFKEYTQEPCWGSADPANPTSRVSFYQYPAMYHANQLMAKGKVKLVEVKLKAKPGK